MDSRTRNLSKLLLRLKGDGSEKDLANKLGVSQYAINQWLNQNHFPKSRNLLKLANYMKLTTSQLLAKLDQEESVDLAQIKNAQTIFLYIEDIPPEEKFLLIKLLNDSLKKELL